MPPDSGMAFVLIQHLSPDRESMLAEILTRHTRMTVLQVEDGMQVHANHVYIIRPGNSLFIQDGKLRLGEILQRKSNNRPVDDFFRSLAEEQRERAICIVMSGMGSNGAAGAQAIKAVGGLCIAQDPDSAEYPSMPRHLMEAGYADYVIPPKDMPAVLLAYAGHPYASGRERTAAQIKRDEGAFREILAILRTRTRQEFAGYKKPTLVRRVQRRMGLARILKMVDYAKMLRHNASEITALVDDLLIHVTGFFRDSEAWEVLRERVIVPMVAAREPDASIRCWVAACASGEEAYTLAMLLVEEAERADKPLDIKIFATDMADRTLQNARAGTYPAGIETEITQERLNRFFTKEDAVYRIRADLRERVVFAPQNVLQDPPFSRIDIATCRNLLIYLEPELQQKLLSLLHFGLREGGTLFLGTSETVAGSDEMFDPIDKKWRIYRRVGPTRHGRVEFPPPRTVRDLDPTSERPSGAERRVGTRPSLAQLTHKALLERHTPTAVTVDRDHRVVYFHGQTSTYLEQPPGEPTRELMVLVRESLRGAVRAALQRAIVEGVPVTMPEGWVDLPGGGKQRILVTVSALDPKGAPDYYVISFEAARETVLPPGDGKNFDSDLDLKAELSRLRDELQSTIEEMQTSNEELKASNEEITSVNEELQSTNEELETSKEEMQSLNEELSTVNAQLQAKMEELQSTSNDLASLLTSTDIAVLFLDTRFRIRRFTPAVRDLLELINTDIGRPLNDLARKFDDPDLNAHAAAVLEKLIPLEREVSGRDGRVYLRRILPYRTTDNHIDGVVITFVDISERKQAEKALQNSEEEFRLLFESMEEGFCIIEVIDDAAGNVTDCRFVQANRAFEREMGLKNVVGKTVNELVPMHDEYWFKIVGLVARTGRSQRFEQTTGPLGRVYDVFASHAGTSDQNRVAVIFTDISERKATERAISAAKEAAEETNRIKDEFFAMLSHELRTPLSAILLWSKVLRSEPIKPDQVSEGLEAIRRSAEAQKELIDDLLDVARINSGKLRVQLSVIDFASLTDEAVEAIRPTADAKGLRLVKDIDSDAGWVSGDANRLRQVIWNLLTNAVKFTPAGGEVRVNLVSTKDRIRLTIADTGRGIEADFLRHIFTPFRQAEGGSTRTTGGLGLGLSIAKRLVELHGGSIAVSSDGKDKGAVFTLMIPRALKPETHAVTYGSANTISNGSFLAGTSILLVEDDEETRKAFLFVLRQAGALVTSANNAADAISSWRKSAPDLLISDIGLPNIDGVMLLQKLRETFPKAGEVPAIAVSAFVSESVRDRAMEAGFASYLTKPLDPHQLSDAVRQVLRK